MNIDLRQLLGKLHSSLKRSARAVLVLAAAAALSCGSRSVEETVTTDARRRVVAENRQTQVTIIPQSGGRPDTVETVGDFIAAAETHLRDKRWASALESIEQAKAMTLRLASREREGKRIVLFSRVMEAENAAVYDIHRQHRADSIRRLDVINRHLDRLLLEESSVR